jgi:hypothetical protein
VDQNQVLDAINNDDVTAHELLSEAMPNAASRFYRTAKISPDSWMKFTSISRMHRIMPHPARYAYCWGRAIASLIVAQQELLAHAAPGLRVEGGTGSGEYFR